jgi:L-ascorbate metabolism protein UlaG (beta-lactamase superfamily)
MKKFNKAYLLILIVTLSGFTNQKNELKITYLANCGFFYEASRSKVLIDPFGTEYGNFFYLPSNETRSNIIEGKVPFNDVDLLLITHVHGDHFNAKLAEAFLLNNPKAKMICPSQVYMQMKDSCSRFDQIKPQT